MAALMCSVYACRKTAPVETNSREPAGIKGIRFGIAIRSSGRECLSIANPNLPSGTPVKLVFAQSPQSTADASVVGPASDCPNLEETPSSSYELKVSSGNVEPDAEAIAVAGPAAFSTAPGDVVVGHIDPGGKAVTFRSCESSEGVHLTVWSGAALQGDRIWHGYHHLDYEVEANCTDKETAP